MIRLSGIVSILMNRIISKMRYFTEMIKTRYNNENLDIGNGNGNESMLEMREI